VIMSVGRVGFVDASWYLPGLEDRNDFMRDCSLHDAALGSVTLDVN
jgi:hypothetical protein